MKKIVFLLATVILFVVTTTTTAFAAANPIAPASAPSTITLSLDTPPPAYLKAVKLLLENKYGENEIKSFVYQVFSLYDRHADVSHLLYLFSDDLEMRLPEGPITSTQDFIKWYAGIGAKYQSNTNTIERLDVTIPAKGDYRVDLIVHWQALDRDGKYVSLRFRQLWKVVNGGEYWPRIVSYIVEPAK